MMKSRELHLYRQTVEVEKGHLQWMQLTVTMTQKKKEVNNVVIEQLLQL